MTCTAAFASFALALAAGAVQVNLLDGSVVGGGGATLSGGGDNIGNHLQHGRRWWR